MSNDNILKIQIENPMFDDAKIFELMERQGAIQKRLFGGFANLGFLGTARDQLVWMDRNRVLLAAAMKPEPGDVRSRIMSIRADVLFHFGNYLASVSAGVYMLYKLADPPFPELLKVEVHARTDALKKCPSHRIASALRNRLLHGASLIDTFNVEERLQARADGPGLVLCPMLSDQAIAAVAEKLPATDGPTMQRWSDVKVAMGAKKDWLTPLLDDHWSEIESAFAQCVELVRAANQVELAEYDQLRAEMDGIDEQLKSMNLFPF